jgi:hypothetical protein
MTVAILLTGQMRTLTEVWPKLYANLLRPNDCVLFVACEVEDPDRLFGLLEMFPDVKIGHVWFTKNFRNQEYTSILSMILQGQRPGLAPGSFERAKNMDNGVDWPSFGLEFVLNSGRSNVRTPKTNPVFSLHANSNGSASVQTAGD